MRLRSFYRWALAGMTLAGSAAVSFSAARVSAQEPSPAAQASSATSEVATAPAAPIVAIAQPAPTDAAPDDPPTVRLPETEVIGENAPPTQPAPPPGPRGPTPGEIFQDAFSTDVEGPFMPDVQGTRIYGGKKTVEIDLQDRPPIANNNLRQAFQRTPGLLISEETTPLVSIGYRGLPPDRAQFMQILKDGIPIHADMMGYPEAYYIPPFQSIDHIDFIHGGAALMYGPQPGGALNFVTKSPNPDVPFEAYTENLFGTYNFFSTYSAISGTPGPMGYYAYFHRREGDGFRSTNSEFDVNYGGAKFVTQLTPTSRWIAAFDLYDESHGEPGGLTREAFFDDRDRTTATRIFDQFQLRRYAASATYQAELDEDTFLETKLWGIYYARDSRRQRGGGFGGVPTSTGADASDYASQEFRTIGFEPRIRRDWGECAQHSLAMGTIFYHCDSPRQDTRGPATGDLPVGPVARNYSIRETNYFSVFAENRFVFDRFTITPGMRMENVWQGVTETINVPRTATGAPLQNEEVFNFAPLFGLGATYDLTDTLLLYGNVSQSYRPLTFVQAVVPGANQVVAGNLSEGHAYQGEVGLRAAPTEWFYADVSGFYLEFEDQVGTVGNVIQNVGDAYYRGAEIVISLDYVGLYDDMNSTNWANQIGSLSMFYSNTWLDAEYYNGPVSGNTPAYAPDYISRGGVQWTYGSTQVMLSGSWLDSHFANDNGDDLFFIPAYDVWDLTSKFQVCRRMAVVAGINNVFNEFYTARITNTGVDPTQSRNYYLGFQAGY